METSSPAASNNSSPKYIYLRWSLFTAAFVAISGITGSWLLSTKSVFFPFYFWIYGSAGKVFLFGILAFFLFAKDKILTVPLKPPTKRNLRWGIVSAACVAGFFVFAHMLLGLQHFSQAPVTAVAAHVCLLASIFCAGMCVFGAEYFYNLVRKCFVILLFCGGMAIAFYFLFGAIYQLWPYLSAIVLQSVVFLLRLTFPAVHVAPPLTIQLPQFAVTVGEYCSGIESLFLSTALYVCIGFLERKRLKLIPFISLYFVLICGMFLINILRVYIIILSGVFISPEIAAKLFHTYLGIILFLGYFTVFLQFFSHRFTNNTLNGQKENL